MSEKQFETKVKKYLTTQGAYFVKYFGCGFTQAGVPDLLVCIKGHFVGMELKASTGRPSPLQIENLKQIHRAGGIPVLLYPKDFDQFKNLIESMTYLNNTDLLHKYQDFLFKFLDLGQ